jgi:MFS family permease
MSLDPKANAALSMACAMSLHFFGYEFARGSNMALFTSNTFGFGPDSASYYTLAMTCVSPMSMVLLLGYGRLLDAKGPKRALVTSIGFCMVILALFGVAISTIGGQYYDTIPIVLLGNDTNWTMSRLLVWASFVFQNSYAHLLYAQMWSFLGSIFTPSQAGTYYSYVAGLSSIASMIAGASVSTIVTWSGVPGLLGVASLSLFGALVLASRAYSISEKNGFDPSLEMVQKSQKKKKSRQNSNEKDDTLNKRDLLHQVQEGADLFRRVPVLAALFFETITFQSLCTVLNTSLVTQLKNAVPNDQSRAAWTGRFYGATNGLSTLFQFLIMPALSQRVDPKSLWKWMPLIPALCAIFQVLSRSVVMGALSSPMLPLYLVAFSFFTAKSESMYILLLFHFTRIFH